MMQMVDLFIEGGTVISVDAARRVISGGAVAVDGGRIVEVGHVSDLASRYRGRRSIDAQGMLVMPGFVNAHNHTFNLLTRYASVPMEGVDPSDFGDVLTRWYWPKFEDNNTHETAYYGALLCCAEMLLHGVTCSADMLEGARVIPGGLDQVARAFLETGMRGVLSYEASERVSAEHGRLGNAENVDFVEKWNGRDGLLRGKMAVHTAFSSSPSYLRSVRELADRYGCGIQLHIAQSPYEVDFIRRHHGYPGSVFFLESLGFLGPDVVASHNIYISEEEVDILARRGVKISFNVKSNQRAGNGVAPVAEFLRRGMTVALGLDGVNIMDMHEMMTHAAFLVRVTTRDRTLVPAAKALEMATIDGARALGLEAEIGSLEAGKKADIILVDCRGKPHLSPLFDPVEAAAFAARGSDVHTVIVDGRVVVEGGRLLTVDLGALLPEVERVAREYLERVRSTPVVPRWELSTL